MRPQTTLLLMLGAALTLAGCTAPFLQGVLAGAAPPSATDPDACPKTTPRFAGQPVSIKSWAFSGPDEIKLQVQSMRQEVELEHVLLDHDRDGTYDATFPSTGACDVTLPPGATETVPVRVDRYASGDCASMDVALNATITDLGASTLASGAGALQARAP